MAQTVHLTLTVDGKAVEGESSQLHKGKELTIECFSLESSVTTPTDPGTGHTTGRREFHPFKIRKRIDRATPRLAEALCSGVECTARFDFYRPSKTGGEDELYYHIELTRATVAALRQILPDLMASHSREVREPFEEVEFTFDEITWFHDGSKGGWTDSWSGQHL